MPHLHRIPITIADILIELTSPLSAADLGIEERLGPFFGTPYVPQMRVALRWETSPAPPVPPGERIYDPGSIWRMHRDREDYYAAFSYPSSNHAIQLQAVLRANRTWDDLTLTEQRVGPRWQSLLNVGAGELLLRTAILYTGGLVVHSSGLDDNGRGIVFVGHSGAGKSTQASLWSREAGVLAMNDDRVAIRAECDGVRCYGTPWGGTAEIARNHSAPLKALIVLEQAPENTIRPIPPAAAAPLLMARAFLPFWDRTLMQHAMTNLSAILDQVPVYRLRCPPEPDVIPLVRSVLCSSPTVS